MLASLNKIIGNGNDKKKHCNYYKDLCPWTDAAVSGETWPDEMTDAVVEVLASQKNNREQRRRKRAEREKKDK